MEFQNLAVIVRELSEAAGKVSEQDAKEFAELIVRARRVLVAGAGRSGFVARGFANRLMHLGFAASFVGEPTTPPIGEGDLLIVSSGSGRTAGLVTMVDKAKQRKAMVATITISPDAPIGSVADAVLTLPGTTRLLTDADDDTGASSQPIGSLFEQLSWLACDALVMTLREMTGQTNDQLLARHANLE